MLVSRKWLKAQTIKFISQHYFWIHVSLALSQRSVHSSSHAKFLSLDYLGSTLFTRRSINPLPTTTVITSNWVSSSSSSTDMRRLPDADLCANLPAYVATGAYLGCLLVNEINTKRLPRKITLAYNTIASSVSAMVDEFHIQSPCFCKVTHAS